MNTDMTKDNDTTENFNATEAGEGGRITGALRSYNPVRSQGGGRRG